MNRSLVNVLFGGISAPAQEEKQIEGQISKTSVEETVESLANAENVIIVGYRLWSNRNFIFHGYGLLTVCSRLWATVWPLPKLNTRSRKSRACCAKKVSMSDSLFTQSLDECPGNVTCYLRRLPCPTIVSYSFPRPCSSFLFADVNNTLHQSCWKWTRSTTTSRIPT